MEILDEKFHRNLDIPCKVVLFSINSGKCSKFLMEWKSMFKVHLTSGNPGELFQVEEYTMLQEYKPN